MRAVEQCLLKLGEQGIRISLEGDDLKCKAAKGVLTPELREDLTNRKAELVYYLQRQRLFNQSIPQASPTELFPLSYAQQRLWFLVRMEQESGFLPTYNMPSVVRLSGALSVEALRSAAKALVARHESLRLVFVEREGEPWAADRGSYDPLEVIDWSARAGEGSEDELEQAIQEHAALEFDLEEGPLFCMRLLRIEDDQHVLLLNSHHIVNDGWSMVILLRDLGELYRAFMERKTPNLSDLPVRYRDFAAWQKQWIQGGLVEQQLAFWRSQLADVPERLTLSEDFSRSAVVSDKGGVWRSQLPSLIGEQVIAEARRANGTVFMVLVTAYKALIARYTGEADIAIGCAIANRTHHQLEDLVGFLVNTLVLRTDCEIRQSFRSLLNAVKTTTLDAYEHQDIPFDYLVEKVNPERSLAYTPLFQLGFVLQNAGGEILNMGDIEVDLVESETRTAKFDLVLRVEQHGARFQCDWEYRTELYRKETIVKLAEHFERLLSAMLAQPDSAIGGLSFLGDSECRQLLEWGGALGMPGKERSSESTMMARFERQAETVPNNIAVAFGDEALSYQELNKRANRLASFLIGMGLQREAMVGIFLDRSFEMVVCLIGVLKAGGAYVPIDPNYPAKRISFMLQDSGAEWVLTNSSLSGQLFDLCGTEGKPKLVAVDEAKIEIDAASSGNLAIRTDLTNLAYVIYTSGSTGKPKGVMIQHDGLSNLIESQIEAFEVQPDSRLLQFASLSFDASVSEIGTALCSGAILDLGTSKKFYPDETFIRFIAARRITHVTLPPSFLAALSPTSWPELRVLVVAGESCPANLPKQWAGGRKFLNAYGPTEATVCVSIGECQAEEAMPTIGTPIPNMRVYLVDENDNPVPRGVAGQLCVAGVGVARGYLNRPETNEESFVSLSCFGREERVYKTGDLAKWRSDGRLEFLGRADQQVKLRGFRIELGEVERVVQEHPRISESVVLMDEAAESLTAYVVAKRQVELWPSIAEFFVYDDILYRTMASHQSRNEKYEAAFRDRLRGKTVLEIGPGQELVLSRLALKAGAKKVYAVELLDDTYEKAKRSLSDFGLEDRITLIHGDVADLELPEKVDFCISEIVGSIGGAEGAAVIINGARRFLRDPANFIPERSVTKFAAVSLTDDEFEYSFEDAGAHYTEKIFEQVGYRFDLRLCLKGFPLAQIISSSGVFEDLDYTAPIEVESNHGVQLEFDHDSTCTGLLVWLTLQTSAGYVIDTLREQESWLPVYLPLFPGGVKVASGDGLELTIERTLCDNQLNPDFVVKGTLNRKGQESMAVYYESFHYAQRYRENGFYERLFVDDLIPRKPRLEARLLRDYLVSQVPEYMVPSRFKFLDRLPWNSSGKIDRKALRVPKKASPADLEDLLRGYSRVEDVAVFSDKQKQECWAYVVLRRSMAELDDVGSGAQAEEKGGIDQWQSIFEQVEDTSEEGDYDPYFNISGWVSSFSGDPIPRVEMQEWRDRAVNQILRRQPDRVLEIGCGNGMLLFQIAPHCSEFLGTDISRKALASVSRLKQDLNYGSRVELRYCPAHDFSGIGSGHYDCIVLNSVSQYFPSIEYLRDVLTQAARAVAPGGFIFVGDVRNLAQAEDYYAAVQLARASSGQSLRSLKLQVKRSMRQEKELLVLPDLFHRLGDEIPEISSVSVSLKAGEYENELTCFRYDVTIEIQGPTSFTSARKWETWSEDLRDFQGLRRRLLLPETKCLAVRGIPNESLARERRFWEQTDDSEATVESFSDSLTENGNDLEKPGRWYALANELGYSVLLEVEGRYTFSAHFSRTPLVESRSLGPSQDVERSIPWHQYGNRLWKSVIGTEEDARELLATLRNNALDMGFLEGIVFVDQIPSDVDGTLDRNALERVAADLDHFPFTDGNGVIGKSRFEGRGAREACYRAPRDRVELELVKIWEQLLDYAPIGIDDDFFERGGHSLLAVRLMGQLERQFGKLLPLTSLFEGGSIVRLASLLRLGEQKTPWSSVVTIQPNGEKRPLFCVHPADGTVMCYFDLARELGDEQPLYGIQAQGMEAGQRPQGDISEMAAQYVNEMRSFQPIGPYQMAGWSFGGLVALEMARLLIDDGEKVLFVGLFDTAVPCPGGAQGNGEEGVNEILQEMARRDPTSTILNDLDELSEEEKLSEVLAKDTNAIYFPPDCSVEQAQRMLKIYQCNVEIVMRFELNQYRCPVTLFRAEGVNKFVEYEQDFDWEKFCSSGVSIVDVPGIHQDLLKYPYLPVLANELKKVIEPETRKELVVLN